MFFCYRGEELTEEEKRKQREYIDAEHLCNATWHWEVYHKPRPAWDHDHCRVCMGKIAESDHGDPEALQAAYKHIYPAEVGDEERYEWVCPDCFDEWQDTFHWRVENCVPSLDIA